jgi:hypothetical protein
MRQVYVVFIQFKNLAELVPSNWFKLTVKPVHKGYSRKPENLVFIYRLKLYALFINGKNETAPYRQWFVI